MPEQEEKTAMISVKITPAKLEEFRIAAMLRGTTMSALLSNFMADVIRREKEAVPEAY